MVPRLCGSAHESASDLPKLHQFHRDPSAAIQASGANRIARAVGPISATTPIDAPREEVFDFLSDLANRPAILDGFVDQYRLERLDPVGVGAAARFRITEAGLWMETVIEEAERPHRILERGRGGRVGRIPVTTAWELTEGASPDGCEVKVVFWTEPATAIDRVRERMPGAGRFYRRGWAGVLARLKHVIESGAPVERVAVAGGDRIPGAG
jgi:uncharacterized protein YndB with AHSA1/START domain